MPFEVWPRRATRVRAAAHKADKPASTYSTIFMEFIESSCREQYVVFKVSWKSVAIFHRVKHTSDFLLRRESRDRRLAGQGYFVRTFERVFDRQCVNDH